MNYYENFSLENLTEEVNGITYTEIWKPTNKFGDIYEISNFGRVKCHERLVSRCYYTVLVPEFIKKQSFDKDGYLIVGIEKEGIRYIERVHRLVGIAFIENPLGKRTINHIKGIKTDNRWHQLEWNTHSENHKHAFDVLNRKGSATGLSGDRNVKSIPIFCISHNKRYESIRQACKELNLHDRWIREVLDKKREHILGYVFERTNKIDMTTSKQLANDPL